ncbi:hypothetical protein ACP275_03G015800 [Erythranthe tilingii]
MEFPNCNLTLDEFIKNITMKSAEDSDMKIIQNPSYSSSSSYSPPSAEKTIRHAKENNANIATKSPNSLSQPQLDISSNNGRDITLDEFLIQIGAVKARENREGLVRNLAPLVPDVNQHMAIKLEQQNIGSNFQAGLENNNIYYYENKGMDIAYKEKNLEMMATEKGSDSRPEYRNERIFIDEKRQKRMIKNRESAARSRARKQGMPPRGENIIFCVAAHSRNGVKSDRTEVQPPIGPGAYINQLEHRVLQLKTANKFLRKRKEIITGLLNSNSIHDSRHQLKRTRSSEF